ncbi:MAG: HD domain-containing phosphohydrolase [Spirochaetia bacterium]
MSENFTIYKSEQFPELPKEVLEDPNIQIKSLNGNTELPLQADPMTAYLLDYRYLLKHSEKMGAVNSGSVILWNPELKNGTNEDQDRVIFQQIIGIQNTQSFLYMIKNFYKQKLLEKQLEEERVRVQEQEGIKRELLNVGIALSVMKDNDQLLEFILRKIRELTSADAGSLYLVEYDEDSGEKYLHFKFAQNDSIDTDFSDFRMPFNTESIAGYVAETGEILNTPDAYEISEEAQYSFNKAFDTANGYRTKSLLTVPMVDHSGTVIGVIQLINRKVNSMLMLATQGTMEDFIQPFDKDNESIVISLASQAAVSLENNRLYNEIETLFEGFVRASIHAIESRDPTTSGHSNRVAQYTVSLSQRVSLINDGKFKNISFTREQLKEIRYASLLHDFGKVGVREHVLVKANKLYPKQYDLIRNRFSEIQRTIELDSMKKRFSILMREGRDGYLKKRKELYTEEKEKLGKLKEYLHVIEHANEPRLLDENPSKILDELITNYYTDVLGEQQPYLTQEEYKMLKIKKGSLSDEERNEIESHVTHTFEFLSKIPWSENMKNVPRIARWHHEKLNGDGYPDGITREQIPIQSKIMAICDIFDALTARDRPYKKAVPVNRALDILQFEVEADHLDKDLVDLFIGARLYDFDEEL